MSATSPADARAAGSRRRRRIAFFDYPDVFEDFYTHYGVTQHAFATSWSNTGNHLFVKLLQREVGDVTWYCLSLAPELESATHGPTGSQVRFFRSPCLHRALWKAFYLPRAAWRWRSAYPLYATLASYLAIASLPLLRALVRDRPDLIFVQDYANGKFDALVALARRLRVPLVAYHTGSRPSGYVAERVKRYTIRRADALIASSARERERLVERYRADPARVKIILTPLDTALFRPLPRTAACAAAELDASRRYFLFVGRLDDGVKRVSVLLRAFAEVAHAVSDVDLVICGAGRDGEHLRALAERIAPRRVRFTGWIDGEERKIALLNCAAALVLVSRKEGFPTVVSEALACGTPVIATDVGGIGEVVEPASTGYIVPVDDEPALRDTMIAMLADREAAEAMRIDARAMAERRLANEIVAEQLRECIDEASRG